MSTTASMTAPPREDPTARVNATLGMVFFVGSWSMAFGSLFLSFLILRKRAGFWPPPGIELPSLPLALTATVVLLASSLAVHLAVSRARAGRSGATLFWGAGLVLGLAFAGLQYGLWSDLLARGASPGAGLYESLFFGLTWVHAAHVVLALVALLWMQIGLGAGRYGPQRISPVSNTAIFWHFMDVVWVLMFLGFFVL